MSPVTNFLLVSIRRETIILPDMRNSAGVKRDFVALGKRHFESVMLLEKSYLNQSEVARGRPRGFEEGGQADIAAALNCRPCRPRADSAW